MSALWGDVNARARGLGTHLLSRARLAGLAEAPDLTALATRLADAGVPPSAEGVPTPADLELSARREAARRLHVLARWLGARTGLLTVVFDEEDRRSVRAMLRGAAAGIPAGARLAGLIPTPSLSERALKELASRTNPREVAMLLALWAHPFGASLLAATDAQHPDLARMELALHRTFAARAVGGARRGGKALRAYVAETVDLLNVDAALLLAGGEHELPLEEVFVDGGTALTRAAWLHAASAPGRTEAASVLATALDQTGFEDAVRLAGRDPHRSERLLLQHRLRTWHRRARQDPLGAAPVLEYVLRLRAQLLQLRALVWATALGMPPEWRGDCLLET